MPGSPSAETWRRVIAQAHDGDARHLLELLLVPAVTDARGEPATGLPQGAFTQLPDDAELRTAIVWVLVKGPWGKVDTLDDMFLKTGWGKGKPGLRESEVYFADRAIQLAGGDLNDLAAAVGVDGETLRKRIGKLKRKAE